MMILKNREISGVSGGDCRCYVRERTRFPFTIHFIDTATSEERCKDECCFDIDWGNIIEKHYCYSEIDYAFTWYYDNKIRC